jgi:hypothetical protein
MSEVARKNGVEATDPLIQNIGGGEEGCAEDIGETPVEPSSMMGRAQGRGEAAT